MDISFRLLSSGLRIYFLCCFAVAAFLPFSVFAATASASVSPSSGTSLTIGSTVLVDNGPSQQIGIWCGTNTSSLWYTYSDTSATSSSWNLGTDTKCNTASGNIYVMTYTMGGYGGTGSSQCGSGTTYSACYSYLQGLGLSDGSQKATATYVYTYVAPGVVLSATSTQATSRLGVVFFWWLMEVLSWFVAFIPMALVVYFLGKVMVDAVKQIFR